MIRNDFVSNSSSSSFILENSKLYDYYNITKKDLVKIFSDNYGKGDIKKYRKKSSKLCHKYGDKKDIEYKAYGPFYIYDLNNVEDCKEVSDIWSTMLSSWDSEYTHKIRNTNKLEYFYEYSQYKNLIEALYNAYDLVYYKKNDVRIFVRTNVKQKNGMYGYYKKAPDFIRRTIVDVRKQFGIMTNLDVAKSGYARFFLHFDDNELWKNEISKDNNYYTTEPDSSDRVCEFILEKLIKLKNIKCDDKKMLKTVFGISEYNGHFNTANGKSLTYLDIDSLMMSFTGHEG